jgi:hypothetical protein
VLIDNVLVDSKEIRISITSLNKYIYEVKKLTSKINEEGQNLHSFFSSYFCDVFVKQFFKNSDIHYSPKHLPTLKPFDLTSLFFLLSGFIALSRALSHRVCRAALTSVRQKCSVFSSSPT